LERAPAIKPCRASSSAPAAGSTSSAPLPLANRYRYRYYTCFSRRRCGTKYCAAERLPAEELDAAVIDALLHTYERTDLFDRPSPRPGAGHGPSAPVCHTSLPRTTSGGKTHPNRGYERMALASGYRDLVLIKWIRCGVTDRGAFGSGQQTWAGLRGQPGFLGQAEAGAVANPAWRTSLVAGPTSPATKGSWRRHTTASRALKPARTTPSRFASLNTSRKSVNAFQPTLPMPRWRGLRTAT
jgi:hypothetical protein